MNSVTISFKAIISFKQAVAYNRSDFYVTTGTILCVYVIYWN